MNKLLKHQGRPENKELQHQIKVLLVSGKSYSQIQDVLGCSRHTISKVSKHLKAEGQRISAGKSEKKSSKNIQGTNASEQGLTILNTKLHRPALAAGFVNRDEIIETLTNQIANPISFVVAPSGYGKSTVVSQWVETKKLPHAWLSLDDEHNNTRIFLSYLIAAIQQVQPNALNQLLLLTHATELPPVKVIAHILINELDLLKNEIVLVIDDYHVIDESSIHSIFNAIIKYPPENVHVCVISRQTPALNVQRLRLHNRLVEIGIHKLSFTTNEVEKLFLYHGKQLPTDKAAQEIKAETEGWIVGLKLIMLQDIERDLNTLGRGVPIFKDSNSLQQLLQQFIVDIPPYLLDVLMQMSVLDRFCEELINEMLLEQSTTYQIGEMNHNSLIEDILSFNLFWVPLDNDGKWYRFHHLFKDVFFTRLSSEKPEDVVRNHKLALNWFAENELFADAIRHALSINDEETAAEIVERNCAPLIRQDKWYTVELWLNQLTEPIIYARPKLLIARMWVLFQQSRVEELFSLLQHLEPLYREKRLDEVSHGEYAFFYGFVMYFSGDKSSSLMFLKEAYERLKKKKDLVLGEVEIMYGLALQMNDQQKNGIALISQNIQNQKTPNLLYLTRQYAGLSFIHLQALDLPKALQSVNELEKINLRAESLYVNSWKDFLKGACYYNGLKSEKAINAFHKSVRNRYVSDMIISINAYKGLILSYLQCNDVKNASLVMQELIDFTEEKENPTNTAMVRSIEARFNLIIGRAKEALIWATSYTEPMEPVSSFVWVESPHITKICVLLKEGDDEHVEQVESLINGLEESAINLNLASQLVEILMLKSILRYRQDKNNEAIALVNSAYDLARSGGYLRPFAECKMYLKNYTMSFDALKNGNAIYELLHRLPETYYTPKFYGNNAEETNKDDLRGKLSSLSSRERDVIRLLLLGYRNKEIGHKLFITTNTVKRHIYNIFKKLNVGNRLELVKVIGARQL